MLKVDWLFIVLATGNLAYALAGHHLNTAVALILITQRAYYAVRDNVKWWVRV